MKSKKQVFLLIGVLNLVKGPIRNPILGNMLIALSKEILFIRKSKTKTKYQGFSSVIKGPLRNPILGNILIALYKEISFIRKSKTKYFLSGFFICY